MALLAVALARATGLADAVEAAWQRSPDTRPLVAQRTTLQARRDAAGRLYPGSPYLQGDAGSDRLLSNRGFASYGVEAGTPVWLPGEGRATVRQAEAGLDEVPAWVAELRLAVAGLVRDAVGQVEDAAVAVAPLERRAAAARLFAGLAGQRARRGESLGADALLARSEALTAAESALADQRALLAQAEARFAVVTGVVVRVPLATDSRNRPRIAAAQQEVSRAEAQVLLRERELEIEARQDRLALEAAVGRLRLAEAGYRMLERRRRQLDQAYGAGETPLVETIRAQVDAFDADLNRAHARAGQDRARARLNQALEGMP